MDLQTTLRWLLGLAAGAIAIVFSTLGDFFPILLGLMVIDILLGLLSALSSKTLSSAASWRGMVKKTTTLLLVGVAALVEPLMGGVDVSTGAIGFFIVTELISIIENAGALGVAIPPVLRDALLTLNKQDRNKG